MRKLKYFLWVAVPLILLSGCLKEKAQITGPQGKKGITGPPGGGLTGVSSTIYVLDGSTVYFNAGPNYYASYWYSAYNPDLTYMLYVSASKKGSTEVHTLPWYNVYASGDELYASIGNDSVKVIYYNQNTGWPADSVINAQIIIVPQQP